VVSRRYYWRGINKDIAHFVKALDEMSSEPNLLPKARRPCATVAYSVEVIAFYVHGLYHKFAGATRV